MALFLTLTVFLVLVTLGIATFYVFGSYLLLIYDRGLARSGHITPEYQDSDPLPGKWRQRFCFCGEVFAIWICILTYPIGALISHPWRSQTHRRRPILLVHGWKHNQSGWLWMRRYLRKRGFGPIYTFNLSSRRGPVQRYAQEIEQMAIQIEEETGQSELVLIGHSLGGLAACYYTEYLAPPAKVSHVITLGSPLQGTRLAAILRSAIGRQMRPGSRLVKEVSAKVERNQNVRYCHLNSQLDNMIFPHQAALLGTSSAAQRTLPAHGHMSLLYSRKVGKQVTDWLRETARVPPAARIHDPDIIQLPAT